LVCGEADLARRGDSAESGWSISVGRQNERRGTTRPRHDRSNRHDHQNKTVLVTGANRGISQALVEEARRRRTVTSQRILNGNEKTFARPRGPGKTPGRSGMWPGPSPGMATM
jgi:hypothetical protein